jgi:hypothetical protein
LHRAPGLWGDRSRSAVPEPQDLRRGVPCLKGRVTANYGPRLLKTVELVAPLTARKGHSVEFALQRTVQLEARVRRDDDVFGPTTCTGPCYGFRRLPEPAACSPIHNVSRSMASVVPLPFRILPPMVSPSRIPYRTHARSGPKPYAGMALRNRCGEYLPTPPRKPGTPATKRRSGPIALNATN